MDVQPVNFRDFNVEDVGVYSVSDGIVESVGYTDIGGNYVHVRMSIDKVAYYGHLKNATVTKGQEIKKGEKLGHLGNSGATNVYHVHFEVQTNYPNLATEDSSIYLGSLKLRSGDVVRIGDKTQSNIDIKSGKG
ncbi:M23 family metallopeptidase [Gemella sp. GH3]|uniref:M23 family metallopeptidase n=1 Tax=unclassified Gemella TaxID=2624949 RepID=UPI00351B7245